MVRSQSRFVVCGLEKLKKDPTTKIETKDSNALKKLEERGFITNKQQLALKPNHLTPQQIYGLPKVNKEGIPFSHL